MDKNKGLALAAGAALVLLLGMNWFLLDQVGGLRQELDSLRSSLGAIGQEDRDVLSRQEEILRESLAQEASLFSRAETELSYENGMLVLEAAVVPKELRAGETALLTLDTGESVPLTDEGSGWLRGRLPCSVREEVVPVVTLSGGERVRREVLPGLWAEELLSCYGMTQWADETGGPQNILLVTLKPGQGPSALQPEAVWVEVRHAVLDSGAPGSLAGRVQALQGAEGTWTADLGEYLGEGGQYDYACYLTVQMEGGLELTSSDPAAEKSQGEGYGHSTSGDCYLRPAF